jgi:hypothetical protein
MFFTDYASAHTRALADARKYQQAMGIEKTTEYGKPGFRVAMIPNNPKNRFGWEFRCEAVEPTD